MNKIFLLFVVLIIMLGTFTPFFRVDASVYSDCVQEAQDQGRDASRCQGSPGDPALGSGSVADACASLPDGIGTILCEINKILGAVVPMLLALGMIYFIWGVVQYMIGGDVENKKKGRDHIIYGLIGLAVIVGVWGLVGIVVRTFGLEGVPEIESLVPETDTSCSTLPDKPKLQDLLCYITSIINDSIIPLLFALAIVVFFWGVIQFVINSDDEVKKTKGKNFMLWGIIGLAVMVSVWGLVHILSSTFNIDSSVIPQVKP